MPKRSAILLAEPAPDIPGCMSWTDFLDDPASALRTAKCLVLSGAFAFPSRYARRPRAIPTESTRFPMRVETPDGEAFHEPRIEVVAPLKCEALWRWARGATRSTVLLLPVHPDQGVDKYFLRPESIDALRRLGLKPGATIAPGHSFPHPEKPPARFPWRRVWSPALARAFQGQVFEMPSDEPASGECAVVGRLRGDPSGSGLILLGNLALGRVAVAMTRPWRGSPEAILYDEPDSDDVVALDEELVTSLLALGRSIGDMSTEGWERLLTPQTAVDERPATDEAASRDRECPGCGKHDCRTPRRSGVWSIDYDPGDDCLLVVVPGVRRARARWNPQLVVLWYLIDFPESKSSVGEIRDFVRDQSRKRVLGKGERSARHLGESVKSWYHRIPDALYQAAKVCPGWTKGALSNRKVEGTYAFRPTPSSRVSKRTGARPRSSS